MLVIGNCLPDRGGRRTLDYSRLGRKEERIDVFLVCPAQAVGFGKFWPLTPPCTFSGGFPGLFWPVTWPFEASIPGFFRAVQSLGYSGYSKVDSNDEGSTSASAAVVTGSSDRYEKHLGRKDRADSIAAYSVTILSQLILSSSLAKNLFDSIAAPSMLSIPFLFTASSSGKELMEGIGREKTSSVLTCSELPGNGRKSLALKELGVKPFYKGEFCLADRLIVASDVAFDGDLSAAGRGKGLKPIIPKESCFHSQVLE
ncbi:hypothetical protein L1987_88914 [Smallanthus sonchifolius]|nr:hypothetical protein L1987_88914 [Smallanthus sonchifolius]